MKRVLKPGVAKKFTDTITQFQQDIHDGWHRDHYTIWTLDRPTNTWDAGTAPETWQPWASGTGRLYENGAGGPTAREGIIYPESPYLFRMLVTAFDVVQKPDQSEPDITPCYLVINGTRLFKVDAFKIEAIGNVLANAYIHELFDRSLPAVT